MKLSHITKAKNEFHQLSQEAKLLGEYLDYCESEKKNPDVELVEKFESVGEKFESLKQTLIAMYGDEEEISVMERENGFEIILEEK